jgi:dienelactone hydrolase
MGLFMATNAKLCGSSLPVEIPVEENALRGDLTVPSNALGLVIFLHASGSSSASNTHAANKLNEERFATLLLDLLTREEQKTDSETMQFRFDVPLLAIRSIAVAKWAAHDSRTRYLPVGLLGTSAGAAAALMAASVMNSQIAAVVSRGGRPDLAQEALAEVASPTLLIVGGEDKRIIDLNRRALARIAGACELYIIPGATHMFAEPGAMAQTTTAAAQWFAKHMKARATRL